MTRHQDAARVVRYAPPPPVVADADDVDALAILRLVRRRFRLMSGVAILTLALALPVILRLVPTYYAETRILIHEPLTSTLRMAVEGDVTPLNLVMEVERLASRGASVKVIEELKLAERPELNPTLRGETPLSRAKAWVQRVLGSRPAKATADPDPLRFVLPEYLRSLTVGRSPTSGVISIGFRSSDPELAAAVPNTLLQVYLREREEQRRAQFSQAFNWFSEQVREQEERVAQSKDALQRFDLANGLGAADTDLGQTATIAAIQARRTELAGERSAAQAKLASYEEADSRLAKLALGDPALAASLERELRLQQGELDRLLETFGERNEAVLAARAKLTDAEALVDGAVAQQLRALENEIQAYDREDIALSEALVKATAAQIQRNEALAGRADLARSVDWERASLDRLREQERALAAEAKLPIAEVEVLSPARLPLSPDGRARSFWLLAAIVASGMLGLTAAVLAEIVDRSVRSPQQLRRVSGAVPVGMVPGVSRSAERRLPRVLRQHPHNLFADAIRGIARGLEQAHGDRFPGSLVVTSAFPNEGAPVLAAALALELAQSGREVLLVDADLTRGRLHTLLGGREAPGVADYLTGAADLESVIRVEPESGLLYIPRGSRVTVCRRERTDLSAVFDYARDNDLIAIFAAVPVLASADTAALGDMADEALLVVRWGRTQPKAVDAAVQRLRCSRRMAVPVAICGVNARRHELYGFNDATVYSPRLRQYFTA